MPSRSPQLSEIELRLERVAHQGLVVGRHDDKVVFVTGGLPGELVRAQLTQQGKRFDRAHVSAVLEPNLGRVEPPCPVANECGGCDWQHANRELQLELKTAVVAEQLDRLAKIQWDGSVEAVAPVMGSRTRMRYHQRAGIVGLKAARSERVVALPEDGCPLATPQLDQLALLEAATGGSEIEVAAGENGVAVAVDGQLRSGPPLLTHTVGARQYRVAATGFWQAHPAAADLLAELVLAQLQPTAGQTALDLYCGVGIFAGTLADGGARVVGLEANRVAVKQARLNVPQAKFHTTRVERGLASYPGQVDLVVLDPPRKGAGGEVVRQIATRKPRKVAYVACDPAALARDLGSFKQLGYEATLIRSFDLFPMTHHTESVAILEPSA